MKIEEVVLWLRVGVLEVYEKVLVVVFVLIGCVNMDKLFKFGKFYFCIYKTMIKVIIIIL